MEPKCKCDSDFTPFASLALILHVNLLLWFYPFSLISLGISFYVLIETLDVGLMGRGICAFQITFGNHQVRVTCMRTDRNCTREFSASHNIFLIIVCLLKSEWQKMCLPSWNPPLPELQELWTRSQCDMCSLAAIIEWILNNSFS